MLTSFAFQRPKLSLARIAVVAFIAIFATNLVPVSANSSGGLLINVGTRSNIWTPFGGGNKLAVNSSGDKAIAYWANSAIPSSSLYSAYGTLSDGTWSWKTAQQIESSASTNVALGDFVITPEGNQAIAAWRKGSDIYAKNAAVNQASGDLVWSSTVKLSTGVAAQWAPRIAISGDGTRVMVAWAQSNTVRIAVGLISGGAVTWSAERTVAIGPRAFSDPAYPYDLELSSDGQKAIVQVASNEQACSGFTDTFMKVITTSDGGTTWSAPTQLSTSCNGSTPNNNSVASFNGEGTKAIVTWVESERLFSRQWSAGTWQPAVTVSTGPFTRGHALAMEGDKAVLAWAGGASLANLFTSLSTDGGTTWSTPESAFTGTLLQFISLDIAPAIGVNNTVAVMLSSNSNATGIAGTFGSSSITWGPGQLLGVLANDLNRTVGDIEFIGTGTALIISQSDPIKVTPLTFAPPSDDATLSS